MRRFFSWLFPPQNPAKFTHYVALGDSMSIDDYPGEEKGAASLFFKNRNDLYPDFEGRDLQSLFPSIRFQNLAFDGASTADVLHNQLEKIDVSGSQQVLFTLTAGGNDILSGEEAEDIIFRLRAITDSLLNEFPQSEIIIATIYDPTDGTKIMYEGRLMDREYATLQIVNQAIRELAKSSQIHVADVYSHFLGHGVGCKDPSNPNYRNDDPSLWYLLTIEPNIRGAYEIRRLFWESGALRIADGTSPQ